MVMNQDGTFARGRSGAIHHGTWNREGAVLRLMPITVETVRPDGTKAMTTPDPLTFTILAQTARSLTLGTDTGLSVYTKP